MTSKNKFNLCTPVLYLAFNRLDAVKKTFPEIQKAKPKQLFIAVDGPRTETERGGTDAVRKYILDNIDWKCDVKTLFRKKNLGCKYAVAGAIDWFFENVEQGIILEDDCLPSQSFFRFCQEMLDRYKDNERIMHISGTNVEEGSKIRESYFFSKTFNVWGWATWKRAWNKYDVEMKEWNEINKLKFIKNLNYSFFNGLRSRRIYELTFRNKINTWDYQWDFVCHLKKGLSIIPKVNLITNLGFLEGTHTINYKTKDKTIKIHELGFPLTYNETIKTQKKYLISYFYFFKSSIGNYMRSAFHKIISYISDI